MLKIIQFLDKEDNIRVGKVDAERIQVLDNFTSTFELVLKSFESEISLPRLIEKSCKEEWMDYNSLIEDKRLLLPLHHPDPYHTWITGTGLTHLGSAASRDAMHQKLANTGTESMTDSMRMFQMGLENGKMVDERPAAQPEWFYKGNGLSAVPTGHALKSPSFAMDGGEEPEIVGIYVNDQKGKPFRVGFALGNEFSDHKMEKVNYLYLAHSKLRPCSYGPELLIGDLPEDIKGKCRIIRNGNAIWTKDFLTGEKNMSHNLANLEYHHFKYPLFRQPADVHVHYFGTSVLSFADGIEVQEGDSFEIEVEEFGKPLVNVFLQEKN